MIMEAFALGRPVLGTFIAGIPELVRPGQNGWLGPAGSVDALTVALAQVLACPVEALEQLAVRGQEMARKQHDVAVSAGRMAELFDES